MDVEIRPTLGLFGKVVWGGYPQGREPGSGAWRLVFLVWRYEEARKEISDIFGRVVLAADTELEWTFTTSWGRNWTLAPTEALELAKEVSRAEASRILQEENQALCERSNRDIARIVRDLRTYAGL